MEFLFETLLELVLEGSFEASRSKIVPMPVRIILAALVVLLVLTAIGVMVLAGVLMIRDGKPLAGAFMLALAALLLALGIWKFVRAYCKKMK